MVFRLNDGLGAWIGTCSLQVILVLFVMKIVNPTTLQAQKKIGHSYFHRFGVMPQGFMGSGYGNFAAGSRSMIGIGNTTALGYVHSVHEETRAGGVFAMEGRMRWSSFVGE